MELNGYLIPETQWQDATFYNLPTLCNALDLDYTDSKAYLKQLVEKPWIMYDEDEWISYATLMHWMVMPNMGRCLSPEALIFAQECAKKTLLVWEGHKILNNL